jgi:GH15 family glucan-1,4-alpha-glucosidase
VKNVNYLPIEDHGVIGNLHTVALVGLDGTIDWCCLPRFDSPSVFGSILDAGRGGRFSIQAEGSLKVRQRYLFDSAILITRFYCESGLVQMEDFMPILDEERRDSKIIRRVRCIRGKATLHVECLPAADYARVGHRCRPLDGGLLFECDNGERFALFAEVDLQSRDGAARAKVELAEGESRSFIFSYLGRGNEPPETPIPRSDDLFEKTLAYWHDWMSHCAYTERWEHAIRRSAVTLKLLTYRPTGAIVAAATMGLPSIIGGERNWDYRYTWIRDAAFTLYALMRVGYTDEAAQFIDWLTHRVGEIDLASPHPLHLMYGIDGRHELKESTLDHLEGYRGSKPVRLGNAAYEQMQLDIYGELMDSIYLYNKYGSPVSHAVWSYCRRIANWLCENWDQPDEGIWETRGGRKNFVYSRLMCWVALDRVARMANKYSLPGNQMRWIRERDRIHDQIMERGWSDKRQAFRQHYDTEALDAANLLMPLVKFISPTDPRMLSTIDAVLENLTTDSLVFRYDHEEFSDGLRGEEGTFSICTFWLVECLTRAGRIDEARTIFERMLGYANHLGLYAEGIGLHGEALGNFPQAFTHLSLISAGYNLNRVLSKRSL